MSDPELSRLLEEYAAGHDRLDRLEAALGEECHLVALLKRALDELLWSLDSVDADLFDEVIRPAYDAWGLLHGHPF